jgi:hypothetical protein
MAENDEPTQLWSDGTPEAPVAPAPPAAAPQPAPPPPPASRGGPPIWLIGGGILVLVLLVVVLAVLVARNIGAPKTAPTQPASSVAASSAAGSTVAGSSIPPDSSSVSATVQDAVNQFGLIGVWAADCTQPVSNDNPYETYAATAGGAVTDSSNMGPDYSLNQYRWDTGHLIGSDQIALDGVLLTDGSGMHVVLQKDADGRMRTLQATTGTGTQLIVNGAFPAGGAPSWASKCSGG